MKGRSQYWSTALLIKQSNLNYCCSRGGKSTDTGYFLGTLDCFLDVAKQKVFASFAPRPLPSLTSLPASLPTSLSLSLQSSGFSALLSITLSLCTRELQTNVQPCRSSKEISCMNRKSESRSLKFGERRKSSMISLTTCRRSSQKSAR